MKNWIKKNKLMAAIVAFIVVVVVIAGIEFLFTSNEGGITGMQALKELGSGFWIWAIVGTMAASAITYFAMKKIKGDGGYGKLNYFIPVLLLLAVSWGKAFDVKADGIGGSKHIPQVQTDSTRIPAEDLLPK